MKALLLAAGLGTRLKPLTFFRAKASLPLLDLPFILYPLQYLFANGVTEVVINLHAHPDSIREAAGNEFRGARIHYSHEPEILGTAGALWKARDLLGNDPFLVLNSDMICDIPLDDLNRIHRQRGSLVTLAIMDDARFSQYGGVYFEEKDHPVLCGFTAPGKKYHYTGLQIVNPEVIDGIPANRKSDVFRDVYPSLLSTGRIGGYKYDGIWTEIGTLKDYLQTSFSLLESPLPERLRPPAMSRGTISANAVVEEGAVVEQSIVMAGARICSGVTVRQSIIGWDVTVKSDANGVALARGILPWWIQR